MNEPIDLSSRRAPVAGAGRAAPVALGDVYGRDAELAVIAGFLDDMLTEPAALTIAGDVGVGKTTLWRAVVAAAHARGFRVLTARPVRSEARLPFAGLGDLLEGTLDVPHPTLPGPQLRALRIALLIDDPTGEIPDQRSTAVATRTLLRSLAATAPTLVAVDDYQWLDPATAKVLEFAVRRLETEPLGFVAAFRPESTTGPLADGFISARAPHQLTPSPLGPGDLDDLFRARLGASFPRPLLTQIAAASGGNPLFALEIAHALERGEIQPQPGRPLRVPATLEQLVHSRLAGLRADVREWLFIAAAASDPTIELIDRVSATDSAVAAHEAIAAGVAELDGERIRFTHPLFASILYDGVEPARRRRLHRVLAGAVAAPDERARHLAMAAHGPDAAVAEALDIAARAAAARGAAEVAADFSQQAYELTPGDAGSAGESRRVQAAEYLFAAGDSARARLLLESVIAAREPGPRRADFLRRLAKVRYRSDSCSVAAELLVCALEESGPDPLLRAGIHRDLGWAVMHCGDAREAAQHYKEALRLVNDDPGEAMLPELLAASSMADFMLGEGIHHQVIGRAIELERPGREVPIEWRPTMMLAMMLKWSGDVDEADARLAELHRETTDAGDETSLPFLLAQMSESAVWAGDWAAAVDLANQAHALAQQTGQDQIRASALYAKALALAHLGQVDAARAAALGGFALAEQGGSVIAMMLNQAVLGFLELSLDEPGAAHARLHPLAAWLDVVGIREPGIVRSVPDEIEALIGIGRLARADTLLRTYARDAERLGRSWAQLAAARGRALHSAASGDPAGAAAFLGDEYDKRGPESPPFERARTLLALGTIQRRTRQRRLARSSLESAVEAFDGLGASLWAAKARRLLDHGRRSPGEADDERLTPGEQRVAELVAAGQTNRSVAERLFVTVRTVEVHLTSIYRKLGVSSRGQLAATMARKREAVEPIDGSMPPSNPGRPPAGVALMERPRRTGRAQSSQRGA